jgi:hypothetical protein
MIFFIFSLSSDFNFLTKFSGIDFFIFAHFYSEYRLQKMGKSNGRCHFCKNEIESLMHLFYRCHNIKHVLDELKHIFNSIFEKNIALVDVFLSEYSSVSALLEQ